MSIESHALHEAGPREQANRYRDTRSDIFPLGSLPLAAWQLDRVLAFLDANLASTLQVKDLAAAARLSVGHFSRVFLRTVGEPPLTYVRRRRIQRAQQLMLSTEKSLSEIVGECGFADQSHLTRLFRRQVGIPPAAWRRLHRASQVEMIAS